MTLAAPDAAAQFVGVPPGPDRAQVVAGLAQISNRLGPDTTGPNVAVWRDMAGCTPGVTGQTLSLFVQCAPHTLIIVATKRLRNPGHAIGACRINIRNQAL